MRPTTATRWRLPTSLFRKTRVPRPSPTKQVDITHLIDEENAPEYSPKNFLPIDVGQIMNDRYDVLAKLGYGNASTVWLAKDLRRLDIQDPLRTPVS
jgi:hypothetical protein